MIRNPMTFLLKVIDMYPSLNIMPDRRPANLGMDVLVSVKEEEARYIAMNIRKVMGVRPLRKIEDDRYGLVIVYRFPNSKEYNERKRKR